MTLDPVPANVRLDGAKGRSLSSISLGMMAFVFGSVAIARPHPDDPAPAEGIVEIVVIAKATGEPIRGATVDRREGNERITDERGVARFDLSKEQGRDVFSVDVWADGFVQQRWYFDNKDRESPKIPGRVTIALHPSEETLGGTIKSESGEPIVGATVEAWGHLGERKDKHELVYMVQGKTDARGRWTIRGFRKMQWVKLYVSHPEYVSDDERHARKFLDGSDPQKVGTLASLRDESAALVMTKGVEVKGLVLDGGKPLAGAKVGWVSAQQLSSVRDYDVPWIASDNDGRFRFGNVRPGEVLIVAKAPGCAPLAYPSTAEAIVGPLTLHMKPGRPFRMRIVDVKGKPVKDVAVYMDGGSGQRCTGERFFSGDDGRAIWEDAPSGTFVINIEKAGYINQYHQPAKADGDEAVIILEKALVVTGTIREAGTGKPIATRPESHRGWIDPGTKHVSWASISVNLERGAFRSETHIANGSFRFRVEAEGYEPWESREIQPDEERVELAVSMKKLENSRVPGVGAVPERR